MRSRDPRGATVTEYELAFSFLRTYIKAAVAAAESGGSVDDAAEFRRHCVGHAVEPTEERVELVRDLAGVLMECLAEGDADDVDADTAKTIAAVCLVDGLERHGWRLAFLERDVRG